MKVLIFGGTGAMGTPLVEFLANSGNNVFITSRKARQSSGNIQGTHMILNLSRSWFASKDSMLS